VIFPLPYAPLPHSDELLSSWMERISIFYGIGYLRARFILDPNRTAVIHGNNEDFDASEYLRRRLALWTGQSDRAIPRTLSTLTDDALDVAARVTYCSRCWSDDARSGQSPYVRRVWSSWSTVLCAEHQVWLCARRPGHQTGTELNGWAPVWQSIPDWAVAACVRHDPAIREFTVGFEAEMAHPPICGWHDLSFDIQELVREKSTVMALVAKPACAGIRADVWKVLEASNGPRITELDLRGYRRDKPGWITERICCVALAVEIRRIIQGRAPAFEGVRDLLTARPDARKLLFESRKAAWQSHSNCQFPAKR